MKNFPMKFKILFLVAGSTIFLATCNKEANDGASVQSIEAIDSGNIGKRGDYICGDVSDDKGRRLTDAEVASLKPEDIKKIVYRSLPHYLVRDQGGFKLFEEAASFAFTTDASQCIAAMTNSINEKYANDPAKRDAALHSMKTRQAALGGCAVLDTPKAASKLDKVPVVLLQGDVKYVKSNMLANIFYGLFEHWNDKVFAKMKNDPAVSALKSILDESRSKIAQEVLATLKGKGQASEDSLKNLVEYFGVANVDALATDLDAQTFLAVEAIESRYCHRAANQKMIDLGYQRAIDAIKASSLATVLGRPWWTTKDSE